MTTYCKTDFKTKTALKKAVANGEKVGIFNPGLGEPVQNGTAYLSGPHGVHTWYATAKIVDGIIKSVK